MGILNFVKKFIKEEEKPKEQEKLAIDEIETWTEDKKEEVEKKDKALLKKIKNLKSELTDNLQEKLEKLENLDLGEKKAEQRIKIIVEENFNNYLRYTSNLIQELKELDNGQSKNLIKDLDESFFSFQKKSATSFEKATYLFGDVGKIRESIDNFVKQLKSLINENQEFIKETEILSIIIKKQDELLEIKNSEKEIKNNLKSIRAKTTHLDNQIKDIEEQIKKIKNSYEYKEELKQKNKITTKKQEFSKEINGLKKLIDLKLLANIYHKNEKEMQIIKDHRSNFQEAFEKDYGEGIKELIEFTNRKEINKQDIDKKIKEIKKSKNETDNLEDNLILKQSVKIELKESEITRINQEIQDHNTDIERNNKLLEKNTLAEEEILDQLITHFQHLNVILITTQP